MHKIHEVLKQTEKDPARFDAKVKKILLAGKRDLVELANRLNVPPKTIEGSVERLQNQGHNVSLSKGFIEIERIVEQGGRVAIKSQEFFNGKWYTFGVLGDTHLYSRYSRLDVLNCLYDIYEEEGINTVFHTGNIIDGEFRFNKFDLIGRSGMGAQIEYLVHNYPARKSIRTRFITGDDHEGWYINREGVNVGRLIQQTAEDVGRTDLEWIGHMEVDIDLKAKHGSAWARVMHSGGGSAYAISYTTQKIVESFQGGEKPQILFVGHHHKFEQGYPREVRTIQTGCTQDQTPFMRKNKIMAMVGGTIVRFLQSSDGNITRFSVEWIPFYDRAYYSKKDKYKRW